MYDVQTQKKSLLLILSLWGLGACQLQTHTERVTPQGVDVGSLNDGKALVKFKGNINIPVMGPEQGAPIDFGSGPRGVDFEHYSDGHYIQITQFGYDKAVLTSDKLKVSWKVRNSWDRLCFDVGASVAQDKAQRDFYLESNSFSGLTIASSGQQLVSTDDLVLCAGARRNFNSLKTPAVDGTDTTRCDRDVYTFKNFDQILVRRSYRDATLERQIVLTDIANKKQLVIVGASKDKLSLQVSRCVRRMLDIWNSPRTHAALQIEVPVGTAPFDGSSNVITEANFASATCRATYTK